MTMTMKSYLRFLSRNKLYTAIEVVGLSFALAFVLLIGSYIWQQYSIAHENPDYDRIYFPFQSMPYGIYEPLKDIHNGYYYFHPVLKDIIW